MSLQFDLSADELPIFLAETDEHLQILDEGLVRLERDEGDEALIQALFRAAHTLKGSAGLIGHRRLVDLTHALETVFDALRKHTLHVTPTLIDLCLQGVDALRALRDEVVSLEPSPIDTALLVQQFLAQVQPAPGEQIISPRPEPIRPASVETESPTTANGTIKVRVEISPQSIASAARALQVLLALQELGEVLESQPTQAQIETAAPVSQIEVKVRTTVPVAEVKRRLAQISELEWIDVLDEKSKEEVSATAGTQELLKDDGSDLEIEEPARLGDYLVQQGLITAGQLQRALEEQKRRPQGTLLGNLLVEMGYISRATLDRALADLLQEHQRALAAMKSAITEQRMRESSADKTVRTSVERLDALMNLIGELITDRNRLFQIRNQLQATFQGHEQVTVLADTIMHLSRITDQLQEEVMRIRMVPISSVFNKFPRMVRDLARKANKEVELIIHGEDTELDRSVIDEIHDPLIHLIRNAIDHGIEPPEERVRAGKSPQGRVTLTARHEQGRIVLTVEDDGRGIDIERLKSAAVQKGLLRESEAVALPREKAID
ncbi:Hpt domain-containing protein, partial [Thermanaerothrix sp.]|uniref:chemotaxis protein CheA n=1 Tax=Thermanaerothrix sp. TaxID=2972675 RepID=UPI003C7C91D1